MTIPERVTALNIKQLQQYVDNGPHAEPFKTGAVWYGRGGVLLSNSTTTTRAFLKFGDVIHRHLKQGDLIIVNRPPSLQKHSLMALHVHMHVGSVFGINPLICAPFGADFDGDSIHVFLQQSAKAMAEVHELLDVPSQLISSQGGQSNSGLTEDSQLGAHLMTNSFVFSGKAEMQQFTMFLTTEMATDLSNEIYDNIGANQNGRVQCIYRGSSLWLQNPTPQFLKDGIHLVTYWKPPIQCGRSWQTLMFCLGRPMAPSLHQLSRLHYLTHILFS